MSSTTDLLAVSESYSPTVVRAVHSLGDQSVSPTRLVDRILQGHPEYLKAWPSERHPSWPDDVAQQSAERWMVEVRQVVDGDLRIFGRLAVIGLCLLELDVARVAERSGLLGGLSSEINPDFVGFLSERGRALLCERAPLVALAHGLLDPALNLRGLPGEGPMERLALAFQDPGSRSIGSWAAQPSKGGLYVGRGEQSSRNIDGVKLSSLGWSRVGSLHATVLASEGEGLVVSDGGHNHAATKDGWPASSWGSVSPGGLAVIDARQREVFWGVTNGGGPVSLPGIDSPVAVAVYADRVAAVDTENRLFLGGADRPWSERVTLSDGLAPSATSFTANESHVLIGSTVGTLVGVAWEASTPGYELPVLTEAVKDVRAGRDYVVVSGERTMAVAAGTNLLARWTPGDEGEAITAVAVSPDDRAIAISTDGLRLSLWRVDARSELRLTSYAADTTAGEDLLQIGPTVDALATLITSRAVEPPLSVGLFGAWGSGKSFFMRALESRVADVADNAQKSARPQHLLWAWRNVRQIRFNAWHYASADVWAGLLERLIAELAEEKGSLSSELDGVHRDRVQRLIDAGTQHADSAGAAKEAATLLERTEAKLTAAELWEQAAIRSTTDAVPDANLQKGSQVLNEGLEGTGLAPLSVAHSVGQILEDAAAIRRNLRSIHGFLSAGRRGLLAIAAAAGPLVGLAALVMSANWFGPEVRAAGAVLTSVIVTIAAIAAWARAASASVRDRLRELDDVEYAARAQVRAAEQGVERARRAVIDARAAQAQAAVEVEKAKLAVEDSSPGSLLKEYLHGRSTSADYRSQLGLIGTVRTDLEAISEAVARHNARLISRDQQDHLTTDDRAVVNRIVLYVDDLDRCPPGVVVRVLEAVHLLLSFPLFVVVVAVDAHWVSKSLISVYPDLLEGGDVTPDEYLEKIFQLPVWLDKPASELATSMALTLMGGTDEIAPDATGAPTSNSGPDSPTVSVSPAARDKPPPRSAAQSAEVALAMSTPEAVVLEQDERDAIGRLAPLIARTPRALKRYLNTYRLLKALVPVERLEAARLLLAIVTGAPRAGEQLLADLPSATQDQTLGDLIDHWPRADRDWLTSGPADVVASIRERRCSAVGPVVEDVRRFVFRLSGGGPRPTAEVDASAPQATS